MWCVLLSIRIEILFHWLLNSWIRTYFSSWVLFICISKTCFITCKIHVTNLLHETRFKTWKNQGRFWSFCIRMLLHSLILVYRSSSFRNIINVKKYICTQLFVTCHDPVICYRRGNLLSNDDVGVKSDMTELF